MAARSTRDPCPNLILTREPASLTGVVQVRKEVLSHVSMSFFPLFLFPGNQPLDFVAIRSVTAENLLVKQTLDAAIGANLVGVALGTNRPTHLVMPTAAKNENRRARQTGSQQT
jgi:hypothetical protein